MAAQSSLGHKRTDSGVGGTGLIPDTLATAESFCTAVSSLASEHGFQAINELVKLAPQRELEIRTRDETIRDLRDQLVALQKERDVFDDQQLSNFEGRYKKWKEQNTTLQNKIDELKAALEEKDSKVTTLQSQLGDFEARVDDLEKENAQVTKRVKEKGQQLGELEAKLQRAQADLDGRVEEIKEAQNRMSALRDSFENEANQHRVLREEANKNRVRLKDFVQFSVKIAELDLPDITVRMEQLWMVATKLVKNFFGRDMPDTVLKSDWTRLRDNDIFKHQIPLPQSNTDAARRMRTAIILGALTRLVDKFVFQPTYLLDEESGLREILRDEASVDPVKERYTRGILLSMSPDEQEANSEGILHHVAKELLETANVRALLTPETFDAFPQALDDFVGQCREEWKIIQRGKQKLEPSFAYSTCSNHPWQLFDDTRADARDGRHSEGLSATTAIENNIVLIPRIYLVGTKADPDPITHGCVIQNVHSRVVMDYERNFEPMDEVDGITE
ncbi:hypothetical protein BU25DRAFT_416521 [Macroventuria anomochaeta]|uniref:Uncharacterized protein n=1 Tax=Macroventuria anomochaeta TaxID=301207 RepID=A0ACB6SJ88_9PLEO|nr:uncharacterized protein BU25DRAFT_416521 [Macroventuria anomochaeta]KAF2633277.1 hypothetical protein BU25DRAFT_416521 [Macroventuria anomochaeta]